MYYCIIDNLHGGGGRKLIFRPTADPGHSKFRDVMRNMTRYCRIFYSIAALSSFGIVLYLILQRTIENKILMLVNLYLQVLDPIVFITISISSES